MSEVRKLAEKLFDAERGPNPTPYSPLSRRPQFSDLWPCDQERYIRMAEAALKERRPDAHFIDGYFTQQFAAGHRPPGFGGRWS